MTDKHKTTIIAEPGKQEMLITREFDAPRELVLGPISGNIDRQRQEWSSLSSVVLSAFWRLGKKHQGAAGGASIRTAVEAEPLSSLDRGLIHTFSRGHVCNW